MNLADAGLKYNFILTQDSHFTAANSLLDLRVLDQQRMSADILNEIL